MVKFNLLAVAVLTSITFSTCIQAEDKSDWPSPMMEMSAWQVMLDRLELSRNTDKENVFTWDATAWYGGDYHRVVLRTEGENQQNDGHPTDLERTDISYSYMISSFWSLQAGLGLKGEMSSGENAEHYAVFSLTGLAPYYFETDSSLLINEDGDVQWLNEFEYDFLLTQTSYLQPRFTVNTNLTDSERFGREAGVESVRFGLRYRQEVVREFAPYFGVYWQKQLGQTANTTAANGEDTSEFGFIAGARIWF
ncbi:MAG: copper resistance protein [Alteromonadaceae bacterium]|nr:copper resistance protein [Alteromonadaceae bacterium]